MKKTTIFSGLLLVAAILGSAETLHARRLKVYSFPRTLAPGQFAEIIFENPELDKPRSITKCNAERLIAWVKSDIPILRIEQNGKQAWMPLGSYNSMGDSCVASFMAPRELEPGNAVLFLVNDRDPSVPYPFAVVGTIQVKISALSGSPMQSLKEFRIVGSGFVPATLIDKNAATTELEQNVGLSKLPSDEQWYTLNRRLINDWDKLPEGDFLYIEQNGKKWRTFVDQCGVELNGLTLDFQAPPDLVPGQASIVLVLRQAGKETGRSAPLSVPTQ